MLVLADLCVLSAFRPGILNYRKLLREAQKSATCIEEAAKCIAP